MEFEGPQMYEGTQSKFVRAGNKLSVTAPGDIATQHIDLARADGLLPEIERLREENPPEVDAGVFMVMVDMIIMTGLSDTLNLPIENVAAEARDKTGNSFLQKSPEGFETVIV